jgi:hypothetical protein
MVKDIPRMWTKIAMHSQHNNKWSAPCLGHPYKKKKNTHIHLKSSWSGTYGHLEYESKRNPGVFYFTESHFTDQENNELLHAKPANPSSLNLVPDVSLHLMILVLVWIFHHKNTLRPCLLTQKLINFTDII